MRVRITMKSLPERAAEALGWKLDSVWDLPLECLQIWIKTGRDGHAVSLEIGKLIEQGETCFKRPE